MHIGQQMSKRQTHSCERGQLCTLRAILENPSFSCFVLVTH